MGNEVKTHLKKRVEVFIEAPALRKLRELLKQRNVSGYSILPVLAGHGHEGSWDASDAVGDAGKMLAVVCIVDASALDELLKEIYAFVSQQIGIITISDVEVIRQDHF